MPSNIAFTGRISVNPRGFGFVTEDGDLAAARSAFVAPPLLNPLLADDLVRAEAVLGDDGRISATALHLVARSRTELVGEVVMHRGAQHLRVDREVANTDLPLHAAGLPLAQGDAVLARIEHGGVRALRRLETPDDRALMRVLARYAIPTEPSPEALGELDAVRAKPHAPGARRDLRDVPTVTIDAASTRDIDDAISVIPPLGDGALRLLVSIADVGAFVPEGSALDRDARERATSVYLAGRVIPMFPEALSADWLSLLPGVDRCCLTAELRIDNEGHVTSVDVYRSLIRSWARLTYDEVARFLDRGEVSPAMEPARAVMPWFRTVSSRLRLARTRRGGVEIGREEARVVVDPATGAASSIENVRPTSAHALIERCMVAANEAVAQWLVQRGVPGMFRVHDEPGFDRVQALEDFATNFGIAAGFGGRLSPLALAAFDHQITGMPAEAAIRAVMLRALGPARYTVTPAGHYGLAAPLYLHFTSPIRRYADVVVHRTLARYLDGDRAWVPNDPAVEALSRHINGRARNAARAETDRQRMLAAQYIGDRLGEDFPARITRVRPFGLVAQLDGSLIEGTLPLDALPDGPFTVDGREGAAVSPTKRWEVGMRVEVRVLSADASSGRVTFALAG